MSQILDAINKAEKQRNQRTAHPKNTNDWYDSLKTPANEVKKTASLIKLLGGATLLCGGLVAGYLFYAKEAAQSPVQTPAEQALVSSETSVVANQAMESANSTPPVLAKPTPPQVENSPSTDTVSANSNDIETITASTVEAKKVPIEVSADSASTAQNNPQSTLAELTPITQTGDNTQDLSVLKPLTAIKEPVKKPIKKTTATKKKTVSERNTAMRPFRTENAPTPSQNKATATQANRGGVVPSWKKNLHITAIVYNKAPEKRLVLIKGKKIHEGGTIPGTSTVVVSIQPKGIIINDGNGDIMIR